MIYPHNFEQKIGFDEIRALLKEECLSTMGCECVDAMKMSSDADQLNEWLQQIRELKYLQEEKDDLPLQYFFDLRSQLVRLKVEGTYFEEQELFNLYRSLDTVLQLVRYLNRNDMENSESEENQAKKEFTYPTLQRLTNNITTFPETIRLRDRKSVV